MKQGNRAKKQRKLSISRIFIVSFVSLMLIMSVGIGYLVFQNWHNAIQKTSREYAEKLNQETLKQVDSFIGTPLSINNVTYKMIQNSIVDLSDNNAREKFFVSVLSSYADSIFSFSYCSANGDFYGAIKDNNGKIRFVENSSETGGRTLYYSVGRNLSIGNLLQNMGKADLRTSEWYRAAEAAGHPAFSPVDKCLFRNEMAVAAVYPIYDSEKMLQGVLTAQILLPDISVKLASIVKNYNGFVAIVERDSGYLIANSDLALNYTIAATGDLKRKTLENLDNPVVESSYRQFMARGTTSFSQYDSGGEHLFVHVQEYDRAKLNWVIISEVPESPQSVELMWNIRVTMLLVFAMTCIGVLIYFLISRKLLKPVGGLLNAAEKFASGDLTQRAPIVRNDEIGRISVEFNRIAEAMQDLVNHLNDTVASRTAELKDSKEQLLLILNSTAEAIYGTDQEGKCTFCNQSCLKLLGYSEARELLGKNMHDLAHYAHQDGSPYAEKDCPLAQSLRRGIEAHSAEEVFWKSDGTPVYVEYHSLPQFRDGKNIGAVVSFLDCTERKRNEENIRYLGCHDSMTGLLNRGCFESKLRELDAAGTLPVSVIYIDLNGLKMVNDTFGHASGDELIRKAATVLKENCRRDDFAARVGGDEFAILLPFTDADRAKLIADRLETEFSQYAVNSVPCSMAVGVATKQKQYQRIEKTMQIAETEMYQKKAIAKKNFEAEAIKGVILALHERNPRERKHSDEVSRLCGELGAAMNLPETENRKLREAGYLHDIGKIILSDEILDKYPEMLTEAETYMVRQHPATGYRLLNLSEDTLDLANGVYGHHERWDGLGYPKGLEGEEISLTSRIIAVADAYERVRSNDHYSTESKARALMEIRNGEGKRFDPQVSEVFVQMMQAQA